MKANLANNDEVDSFYSTFAFDPTESPHTDLDEVPQRATIEFESDEGARETAVGGLKLGAFDDEENDVMMDEMLKPGIGVKFLIRRAMIDPDATVIPIV